MGENDYTKYSYNPYQTSTQGQPGQQAPLHAEPSSSHNVNMQPAHRGSIATVLARKASAALNNNPLLATVSLMAVGAVFAGLVVMGITGQNSASTDIPVIKAETIAFKDQPGDAGGVSIPNEDSTIFSVMRDDAFEPSADNPVKNLLSPNSGTEEAPVADKLASFDEQPEESLLLDTESKKEPSFSDRTTAEENTPVASAADTKTSTPDTPSTSSSTVAVNQQKVAPQDLIRKADTKRPDQMHAAGSSPETLAFVRSVLDQKDVKTEAKAGTPAASKTLNGITPAAGGDTKATSGASTGQYYVQLGSVTNQAGAEKEWNKLSSALDLTSYGHRIEEANLGERGTYYRIQAGPFAKEEANTLCGKIKAHKPGGCLVVK